MAALKLLNLLALASVAILTIASGPTQVNALVADRAQVARQVHAHEAIARRKRDDNANGNSNGNGSGRCKPRPTSSLTSDSASAPPPPPTSTPPPPPPADTPPPPPPTSSPAPPPPPPPPAPSSAPPPAPTTAGLPGNGKKMGLGWPNGDQSWLANFARPNVGYLYTWSPFLPTGLDAFGITGIPMLWGYNQISDFQNLVVQGYANIVLGMNEPNEPSQSNISPQDGVNMWMQYINPLQYQGYYLVSPACTDDDAGLQWYQQFFAGCQSAGCHVDAIAFHAYTTNAQDLINYATQLHNTYNLPIWITEFADQNYSGTGGQASMDEIWAFAGQVVDFVNNTPWLEVAFPFGVMGDLQGVNTANALLGGNNFPTSLAYTYFG